VFGWCCVVAALGLTGWVGRKVLLAKTNQVG